ncbi:Putative succinate-semialdehyde dehydrogenase [NADP(+)] 2 [Corynebacterium occultum]|uniref:succinate-semialdehyde dehydrogenase (NADP(+)) n=1 Tax=Corynebacterium occultum TaxID=2675219 RepID=A0A6B8VSP8_9CORY|nr:succinic semialdehyde dehydrogenase [Corynebacterium occultum]QGU06089.1 Putative succinate-semialdehyde dehydrogenase [NADP(+)] 2 [Corynebacterium occultum]
MNSITVTSPSDGRILGTVPAHTATDTSRAFERARRAQKQWAHTPVKERREIMLSLHDLVLHRQEQILDTIQDESGKNRASAFDEVMDVAVTARHYAYATAALLHPDRVKGALPLLTSVEVQHSPKGVVGIIAPWNYPLVMAVSDAIPAILAGNTVVLKPDDKTPLSALLAAELLAEAGLPQDVFQVVTGTAEEVGQQIVAECDYLMFTGSTKTGRLLASQAGERLIDFSAELGGKNPLIIAADADLNKVVPGAITACFSNSGQLCISIERIYVHRNLAAEFSARFQAATKVLRVGAGREWTVEMGSLISEEQLARVQSFVDDAVARGATILSGGHALPELGPCFFAPTILSDVPEDAELFREEAFGPVAAIEIVDSHEEAIRRANDSDYGLNASVWAKPATGRKIAAQLEFGTVNINEGFAAAWGSLDAPMGGWKASGVGRRHADEGLLKYTESRTVALQRGLSIAGPSKLSRERYARTLSTALRLGKRVLR